MECVSKQLMFKFACIVIACLVTLAGIMMSMDLLQQLPATNPTFWSGTNPHFNYQMEQFNDLKRLNRKWGPLNPPASRLLLEDFDESKLRMTPEAQRWNPFLRRTKGFLINYDKQSNSTQYTYLFPDPVPYPSAAPEPAIALAPLFGNDYGLDGQITNWTNPDYFTNPPLTGWVEPPIA